MDSVRELPANAEQVQRRIRELEEALRESQQEVERLSGRENLLHQIMDALPAMVGYVDLNQTIVFANRQIERWYGIDRANLTGVRLKDLFSEEHYRTVQGFLHQVLSGQEVNRESEITYPDGVRRHVHLNYIPDRIGRQVNGYFFLVRDISQRKRAEEELRESNEMLDQRIRNATTQLESRNHELINEIRIRKLTEEKLLSSRESLSEALESMTDGFMLFDSDGLLVTCNRKIKALYPGSSEALQTGARFSDLIRLSAEAGDIKEAVGRVDEWVNERLDRYPSFTDSVEIHLADGRWILATDRPTRSGGVVGLRTDITVRKENEEKIRLQEEQMASVLRRASMGEVASALAHEISQPLAAITNYSRGSLLRLDSSGEGYPEVVDALQKTVHEAERAKSIIRHVSEFVRQSTPTVSDCLLSELIEDVLELATASIKRNGIRTKTSLPNLAVVLMINRIEVEQVLFNLIRNSIDSLKQSPSRHREIDLIAELTPDHRCRIAVSDNGSGIDPAMRETLFEPYVTNKESGLGMGLSISRTIVESHGGSIWIEDDEAGRTRVVFSLPDTNSMAAQ